MKKIYIFLLIILLTGCNNIDEEKNIQDKADNGKIIELEDEYIDNNPIKLGLYLYDGKYDNKTIIDKEYYTNFISGVDIGSFEVFYTNDKIVTGSSFKEIWNKYYSGYNDISDYKIGFNIKFILDDGTNYNANFLEPDIFKFSDYFYVYLYDDVNQKDGVQYSHLEEVKDNTLITSIKLYAVDNIDRVENIILTVFTYNDEDDFASDGSYHGSSHYTIRIKKNK